MEGAERVASSADETSEYDLAEPPADSMIESMRAFGYDLPTAIADLIDNSISAGARNVWLQFHWSGARSHISLLDDGCGMSHDVLVNAMRPGSRNPLEPRDPRDLGRFGLGLKTASFSQCRRLTVASRPPDGKTAVRCWDLDYVTHHRQWRLLKTGSEVLEPYIKRIGSQSSGTAVLWEDLDRITPEGTQFSDDEAQSLFFTRADAVRQHVAMVFHRMLEAPRGLRIWVNGAQVAPWDPFLTREEATQQLTEAAVSIFGRRLNVRPFVLPHHSKITSEVHAAAAGPRGWNAQQGFYVYRNKRLIAAGDWLGLGYQKEEHYKLARIMLDIPNSMDADWEIDVKKSRASPPPAIRKDLKRLADLTRSKASAVYRHRGSRISRAVHQMVFLWERRVHHGKISYSINREHPLVKSLVSQPGEPGRRIRALLSVIEETIPVPTITMDSAEAPDAHTKPFEAAASTALRRALQMTYGALRAAGFSCGDAKVRLLHTEPFSQFPELVAALDDQPIDSEPEE